MFVIYKQNEKVVHGTNVEKNKLGLSENIHENDFYGRSVRNWDFDCFIFFLDNPSSGQIYLYSGSPEISLIEFQLHQGSDLVLGTISGCTGRYSR